MRRLRNASRSEPVGLVALAVVVILVLAAIAAPLFTRAPDAIDPIHQLLGPSVSHWFGTDDLGRDVFSRTVYAGRVSLGLGAAVTVAAAVIGTVLGLLAGVVAGIDGIVMRAMDGMMAFPPLVLAIAIVAVSGPGLVGEAAALTIVFIPRFARVARASALQLRKTQFMEAATVSGSRVGTIMFRHILPNAVAPLVVLGSFIYAETILSDAALSFLGLGAAPPTPTWGNIISEARPYIATDPSFSVFPGIVIAIAVVSLNLASDFLRAWLLPSTTAVIRRGGWWGRRSGGRQRSLELTAAGVGETPAAALASEPFGATASVEGKT